MKEMELDKYVRRTWWYVKHTMLDPRNQERIYYIKRSDWVRWAYSVCVDILWFFDSLTRNLTKYDLGAFWVF